MLLGNFHILLPAATAATLNTIVPVAVAASPAVDGTVYTVSAGTGLEMARGTASLTTVNQ